MYVIFPADELILLTYGVAVPRVRTRPTLDNLREPLVPIGSRPSSNISQSRTLADHIQIENNTSAEIDNNNDNYPENFDPADFSYDCDSSNLLGTTDLKATSEINNCLNISSTTSTNKLNSTSATAATTAKGKKSKLKLKLRRLRPHSSAETTAETARIREDLQIHVTNPIFTRDNLRERNFDAFFECGETVYSLAIKDKQQLLPEPEPPPVDLFTSSDSQRPNSFGFFRKVKSPDTLKAKSADNILTAEESQKDPSRNRHRNLFKKKGAANITVPIITSGSSMSSSGGALKDLGHPSLNEALKTHNSVTFKLVKTVSDFTETLAQLYEQHAEALQALVSSYRKKNGELRKERPSCQSNLFHAWETYLQEIEADSQATVEVANALSRQVARPLLERSFHRKVQSRKVFTHRESFDTIISKTEEKLSKCRTEYKQCYIAHRQNPNQHSLTQYIDSHNAYVQQLHATNAMIESYHCETLPALLQELEEIYNDLCTIVTEAVLQGAQTISFKAIEQAKRYDGLAVQCKSVSSGQDLEYFVRSLQIPSVKIPKKNFAPPQPPTVSEADEYGEPSTPLLKNELIVEKGASLQVRPSLEALKRESQELEIQIKQLQDSVDGLVRTQIRGLEGQLYNKANELQEDISMKKFDLRAKQIHLSAVSAQKELFLGKIDLGSPRGERKMSSSSSSSMKTKWLKAFRSLKPTSTNERKNGNGAQARLESTDSHNLQEYTYKKITPCDVCSQVLRGHTRQGLRCRICKVNVHADCAPQVPPKCQMKQKLLRRQKSTPEIENRVDLEDENDGEMVTRPFGQPLCFVAEEPQDEELSSSVKGARRKK